MMAKIRSIALISVVVVVFSVSLFHSQASAVGDAAELKKLIHALFDALDRQDYQALRQLCTEDFILFEAGKIMDMDATIAFLRPFEGKGKMTRTFSDFKTHVDGTAAWMHLRHKASGIRDGKKREVDWFESAGFRKEKDVWKIALYHNSVVEPVGK